MAYISPSQAAKIIGISKKTLHRWDEEGRLPVPESLRKDSMNSRKYLQKDIETIRDWRKLRKEEKDHLRKLPAINKEKNRFFASTPLDALNPPKYDPRKRSEMKKAFADLKEWRKKHDLLSEKQARFSEKWLRGIPSNE